MPDHVLLAQKIRKLVASGELTEAIEFLIQVLSDHEELDKIILKSARLAELKEDILSGTITDSVAGREKTLISRDILTLVRKLEHEGKADTKVFISYHRNGVSKKLAEKLHDELES